MVRWFLVFAATTLISGHLGPSTALAKTFHTTVMTPGDVGHCWFRNSEIKQSKWVQPFFNSRVKDGRGGLIDPDIWQLTLRLLNEGKQIFLAVASPRVSGRVEVTIVVTTRGTARSVLQTLVDGSRVRAGVVQTLRLWNRDVFALAKERQLTLGTSVAQVRRTAAKNVSRSKPKVLMGLRSELDLKGTVSCVFRIPKEGALNSFDGLAGQNYLTGAMALELGTDVAAQFVWRPGLERRSAVGYVHQELERLTKSRWIFMTGTQPLLDAIVVSPFGKDVKVSAHWSGRKAHRLFRIVSGLLRLQFPFAEKEGPSGFDPPQIAPRNRKPEKNSRTPPKPPPGNRIRID